MRGNGPQALATAREAATFDAERGGLQLAEILASLDRSEEAHQQLELLRSKGAPQAEIDRRLALLAFNSGDYKEAKQRFTELLSSGEGNDGAQLYLADIEVRTGDPAGCSPPTGAAVRLLRRAVSAPRAPPRCCSTATRARRGSGAA